MNLQENLTKATQAMNLTVSDIRAAHKSAIHENQMAEILLLELLAQSVALEKRLKQLEQAALTEGKR
jgi:hypothetical protein